MPTATVNSRKPARRKRLDEHRDDLGVGRRARRAHELDADLRELPRLAAQRLVLAEDLGGVAEAVRAGLPGEARRDEARDRHRHVGPQREQPAVQVDEPKRGALQRAGGSLERVEVLDDRRLDQPVAPRREHLGHGA